MQLGKYFKVTADKKRYAIDYSDWLDTGELVRTVTYEVTPTENGCLVIDTTSIDSTNTQAVFYASAGNVGISYTVTATMNTSAGQVRVDTIQFVVKSS